jgi:hypothetical protein
MDAVSVGAALALMAQLVPGLSEALQNVQEAIGSADSAADLANGAAANAANNDKALSLYITMTYAILRKQQKEIDDLKNAVAALAT